MNSNSTQTVSCMAASAWPRPSVASAASLVGLPVYLVPATGLAKHAQKRFTMGDTIDSDGWPLGPRDGTSG
jgi:hypothetical protein